MTLVISIIYCIMKYLLISSPDSGNVGEQREQSDNGKDQIYHRSASHASNCGSEQPIPFAAIEIDDGDVEVVMEIDAADDEEDFVKTSFGSLWFYKPRPALTSKQRRTFCMDIIQNDYDETSLVVPLPRAPVGFQNHARDGIFLIRLGEMDSHPELRENVQVRTLVDWFRTTWYHRGTTSEPSEPMEPHGTSVEPQVNQVHTHLLTRCHTTALPLERGEPMEPHGTSVEPQVNQVHTHLLTRCHTTALPLEPGEPMEPHGTSVEPQVNQVHSHLLTPCHTAALPLEPVEPMEPHGTSVEPQVNQVHSHLPSRCHTTALPLEPGEPMEPHGTSVEPQVNQVHTHLLTRCHTTALPLEPGEPMEPHGTSVEPQVNLWNHMEPPWNHK
ncbi:uncharacterized protein LOC129586824 [Paramacrobiotus metropolitanus]|uniref:uncharacterized protein LOC129586824 n=1 Tax=Paramacrobiotus metropolitanus TaxID=2943436 RepID=UPI002445B45D|nr:uncharacterized protein LOC129586824 [Paramacrobiotus metropolitanus]